MKADTVLGRSILMHGMVFFLAQCTLLAGVTFAYGMQWLRCALFIAISAIYHGTLTALLFLRREDFHLEGSKGTLARVNLSNTLTIGRLSSIPTLLFLVLQASSFPGSLRVVIVPLMCLVFVTDLLDGIVARRRKEITFVGRYLDSTSDYLMIIALSIAFYAYGIIPLWFFILIVARLGLFAIGMAVLALRDGRTNPLSTFLGKASVFAVMVLYVMEIAGLLGVPWIGNEAVIVIVEYVVAAVIVASFVDKAVFLTRMFTAPREEPAREEPARPSRAGRLP
jgi:CDP-diacylglycerol--glycerol-3-phosphate 3-phosphatidyltransferase